MTTLQPTKRQPASWCGRAGLESHDGRLDLYVARTEPLSLTSTLKALGITLRANFEKIRKAHATQLLCWEIQLFSSRGFLKHRGERVYHNSPPFAHLRCMIIPLGSFLSF